MFENFVREMRNLGSKLEILCSAKDILKLIEVFLPIGEYCHQIGNLFIKYGFGFENKVLALQVLQKLIKKIFGDSFKEMHQSRRRIAFLLGYLLHINKNHIQSLNSLFTFYISLMVAALNKSLMGKSFIIWFN